MANEDDKSEAGTAVFAIASNGQIFVNAQYVPERLRKGRKASLWYVLSQKDARNAARLIEALAFNVPAEVFAKKPKGAKVRARDVRKDAG